MKSKCITDKHTHKYQMIIIYRRIAGLLPQIHTFFPNQWMNFSVLRPYFTKTFKTQCEEGENTNKMQPLDVYY